MVAAQPLDGKRQRAALRTGQRDAHRWVSDHRQRARLRLQRQRHRWHAVIELPVRSGEHRSIELQAGLSERHRIAAAAGRLQRLRQHQELRHLERQGRHRQILVCDDAVRRAGGAFDQQLEQDRPVLPIQFREGRVLAEHERIAVQQRAVAWREPEPLLRHAREGRIRAAHRRHAQRRRDVLRLLR